MISGVENHFVESTRKYLQKVVSFVGQNLLGKKLQVAASLAPKSWLTHPPTSLAPKSEATEGYKPLRSELWKVHKGSLQGLTQKVPANLAIGPYAQKVPA